MPSTDWHGLSFADIDARLCTYCGTCLSACPVDALHWQPAVGGRTHQEERIAFDRATCTECGLCYAVCPPESSIDPGPQRKADPLLGPYLSLGRGYAADNRVREAGSAGGAVTALLTSALTQNLIDGAVVVSEDHDHPARSVVTVARTQEEIVAAAQSRYALAPVNAVLGELRGSEERLAVVALPCQVYGLRLAQALNLAIARPVRLVIGLFCGFSLRYEGTAFLVRKLGLAEAELERVEYRGGPWPGGFRAVTRDGRDAFVPKHHYTYVHLMHAPQGCWYCPDLTAEFADVSVGDFWHGDEAGYSTIIGRTPAGQALVDSAQQRGELQVEAIPREGILASHSHLLSYKKKGVQVRRQLSRLKPVAGYPLPHLQANDRVTSALFFAMLRASSSRPGQWALGLLPLRLAGWLSSRGRSFVKRQS